MSNAHVQGPPSTAPVGPATPTAPRFGELPAQQSLAELHSQAQALTDQLTALVGQSKGLAAQLRVSHGAARSELNASLREVTAQVSDVSGQLTNVRAQIAFRQLPADVRNARIIIPGGEPPALQRRFDPDLVVGLMFAFIFAVLMPISIAVARRIWRRATNPPAARPAADLISPRLDRLEQAVDAIAIEVERISEGQRFVTRVLVERPAESLSESRAATAHRRGSDARGAPMADPAPIRALGAGPMEPVRAAERQAIRESITPH